MSAFYSARPYDPELAVSWGRVLAMWWLMIWRQLLITLTLGLVLIFIGFAIAIVLHVPKHSAFIAAYWFWLVFTTVCNVVVLRMALNKQYARFRVALVPRASD